MKIETNRLIIRPFEMSDIKDVYEYASQKEIGENAGWPSHKSLEQSGEILSWWIEEGCKHAIVYKENSKVIGHIAVDEDSEEGREDTRELGCALNRDYHRKGIMTEAITAVLNYLYNNSIEYVWACCFEENKASKGLIEKCGFVFQQEGSFYSESLQKEFSSYEYRLSRDEWKALNK